MGDRANIILTEQHDGPKQSVYLYTHWNGYQIERLAALGLRKALDAGRGTDAQYGGRLITDVFLAAHADTPELGAGVSAMIGDGEDHTVEIDFTRQTVVVTRGGAASFPTSFAAFVASASVPA